MFKDSFKSIPVLETERLILKQFTIDDIPEYRLHFENLNVQKYLGGLSLLRDNERDAKNWLRNINDRLLKLKLVFTWHITDKQNKSIGRIDLGGFQNKKAAEISYYIWEENWGRGYAPEAVKRVVEFGLKNLELARIQAVIHVENTGSQKTIEKAGFIKEGMLKNFPLGKSISDVFMYSVTSSS